MGVLYVISDRQSASTAIELASKERGDVSILLIGEARGLIDGLEQGKTLGHTCRIYCLDANPKGTSQVHGVEAVDYFGWVELIEENDRIVSWT
ncbi:MAG: hypothetical protein NWE88_11650 [Candidatus Bathyarchaeota archaeon]|nr:hypothetical protein [Candidatus Bathyarchaeota archaeon]